MSIGSQTQTESPYLSSSVASLHRSRKPTSEISKTYKHASQLYLTRRLVECYEVLQPVVQPTSKEENEEGQVNQGEDESTPSAPIASASTSQRIKIWSLYVTLLNTILELGDEEGKRGFGSKLYHEIVRNVQAGDIWEQVVQNGYKGREASVDAEVIYNLSNLLLAQAPDQVINQARLETYLSSSPHGSLDFSNAFQNGDRKGKSGTDTPRDLNSRIKILELFTLHVLPRNNEWDYARSFVSNSDILDEDRREAFLQTINELQEVKEQEEAEAKAKDEEDLVGFAETDDEETTQQDQIQMNDGEDATQDREPTHNSKPSQLAHGQPDSPKTKKSQHRRTSSEVDYGIEDDFRKPRTSQVPTHPYSHHHQRQLRAASQPQSTTATKATSSGTLSPPPNPTPAPSAPPPSTTSSAPAPTRKPSIHRPKKAPAPKATSNSSNSNKPARSRLSALLRVLSNLYANVARSIARNPTQVFRTVMFLFAFLVVLARRDVRERLKRVLGQGWSKMVQTAGMGVKVSYV